MSVLTRCRVGVTFHFGPAGQGSARMGSSGKSEGGGHEVQTRDASKRNTYHHVKPALQRQSLRAGRAAFPQRERVVAVQSAPRKALSPKGSLPGNGLVFDPAQAIRPGRQGIAKAELQAVHLAPVTEGGGSAGCRTRRGGMPEGMAEVYPWH